MNNSIAGLKNIGNTCFMNSGLQIILRCKSLRDFLLSHDKFESDVLNCMKELFVETGRKKVVAPTMFKKIMKSNRFKNYTQEDSHEFLGELLDQIEEALKEEFKTEKKDSKEETLISDIFDIHTKTLLVSRESKEKSEVKNTNRFMYISVTNKDKDITLNDCLKRSFRVETLKGDAKWKPEGKDAQEASKMCYPTKFPNYLIMLITRYSYSRSSSKKLSTNINVKQYWKSAKVFPENMYYELVGFVNQMGGMNSGHYVSYIKKDDKWFCCNDSNIMEVNTGNAIKQAKKAYLLFFESKDERVKAMPEEKEEDYEQSFGKFNKRQFDKMNKQMNKKKNNNIISKNIFVDNNIPNIGEFKYKNLNVKTSLSNMNKQDAFHNKHSERTKQRNAKRKR